MKEKDTFGVGVASSGARSRPEKGQGKALEVMVVGGSGSPSQMSHPPRGLEGRRIEWPSLYCRGESLLL